MKNLSAIMYIVGVSTLFLITLVYTLNVVKINANQQEALTAEYGNTVIIEYEKPLNNKTGDKRLLITTSSKDKVIAKGYWVVLTKDGKTIKLAEEIKNAELTGAVKNSPRHSN